MKPRLSISPNPLRILIIGERDEAIEEVVNNYRASGFVVDFSISIDEGIYRANHWEFDAILIEESVAGATDEAWFGRQVKDRQFLIHQFEILPKNEKQSNNVDTTSFPTSCLPIPPATLTQIINNHNRSTETMLRTGTINVHLARQEVTKDGITIDLSAVEYRLVEFFIRKKGLLITREALAQDVFQSSPVDASNLIDVYIYKLRQKLGKSFIKTRRGLGYITSDQ
ncbi:MAG: winged helix-turn-helix domain-containing protein [Opitutaceae bacterium]